MHVSQIAYYPIKSCGGLYPTEHAVGRYGFVNDRRWLLVDEDNIFRTQRETPRMALIKPSLTEDHLIVTAPDMQPLLIPIEGDGARVGVKIWRDEDVKSVDQGDDAAQWFSDYLGVTTRLVRFADDYTRRVPFEYAKHPDDQAAFADAFPFLVISEASLTDLNNRLDEPLPMNRFRPNIVIAGADHGYAEDEWGAIRINGIRFDLVKPCGRCAIITTDQVTAARGKEPLRTLNMYRPKVGGSSPTFGMNAVHAAEGSIRVGDAVEIIVS